MGTGRPSSTSCPIWPRTSPDGSHCNPSPKRLREDSTYAGGRKHMMKATIARVLTVVGMLALVTTAASADESASNMRASLSGFNEVKPIATAGAGMFKATASNGAIDFTLTYSGLTTPAFMAHFHFAEPAVNGGVFIWLCGNPGTPAHQPCPPGTTERATVTGDITAGDIP